LATESERHSLGLKNELHPKTLFETETPRERLSVPSRGDMELHDRASVFVVPEVEFIK
jgi:hypothetical protein